MSRLPSFLLLLLAVALANPARAQTLQEKRFGASAPGDTLPKVITREFELYGPTVEDVRQANDEIRVAISQFGRYLGEQPKKMAFVLFRSAEDAARFDSKPLTRRGMVIVPWITPPRGAASPATPGTADPLAHEAGHRFLIAYTEHALDLAAGAGASGADPGAAPNAAKSGAGPAAQTGLHADVPILPDWLEEAVAGLCERPSFQKSRMDFMRAHLDQRIPVAEFLDMPRPAAPAPDRAKGGKPGTAKPSARPAAAAGAPAAADRFTIYCDEALSLARFIAHREDDRFVGGLVEGVLRGRTVGDVLNTSQTLFSKPDALEKQWLEWMQGAEHAP